MKVKVKVMTKYSTSFSKKTEYLKIVKFSKYYRKF